MPKGIYPHKKRPNAVEIRDGVAYVQLKRIGKGNLVTLLDVADWEAARNLGTLTCHGTAHLPVPPPPPPDLQQ